MGSPAGTESSGPETGAASSPESSGPGPVAVVWCRQVDNEAESPGYTTVPEVFPGRKETLELIRLVGNLTVNVADTHDYWTPGPPQALSYYPNLFLYPAYGGRYTCVGRMFLSTEDRPRLGMKTLILDTSQLLASGEFGPSILRWHATMAGGRGDGRKPAIPDPGLYGLLGEGLLFFRGTTEPVVVVASNEWDAAMEVIFDLVRVLPASLLMLGAILAFPYFLPQPKTNLYEFAEQVPLALSLMRIPMAEAMGDRHKKRIQSWESSNVTFRDLTTGIPTPAKGREGIPQVLQYVRDHDANRLPPIVGRVDLVEVPKLRELLADPERQSGKERRKEMWRIGTAMESAALLLQRSRGRHIPVSLETAKRAQEYLRVEPPRTEEKVAEGVAGAGVEATPTGHPSWLTKAPEFASSPRSGPEVIPVSVSDDPSLQAAALPAVTATRRVAPPAPPVPAESPAATPAPAVAAAAASASMTTRPPLVSSSSFLDRGPSTAQVEAMVSRALGPRLAQLEEEMLRRLASEIEQAVATEVDRRVEQAMEARVKAQVQASETRFAQALTALDTRWQEKFRTVTAPTTPSAEWRAGLDAELDQKIAQSMEARDRALAESVKTLTARLTESEVRTAQQVTGMLAGTESRLRESLPTTLGAEIDRRLRSQFERELTDSAQGEKGAVAARIDARIDSAVRLQMQGANAQFARSLEDLEEKWAERLKPFQSMTAPLSAKALESVEPIVERRVREAMEEQARTLQALREELAAREEAERAGLAAQQERQLTAALAQAIEARESAEAQLRQDFEAAIGETVEKRTRELRELESRLTSLLESRNKEVASRGLTGVKELEARLKGGVEERAAQLEARLVKSLESRLGELRESQTHADADLQVRLQSYTDQKLREVEEHLRATTVDLLARLRADVEGSLGRIPDPARIDAIVKDRLQRTAESLRTELQLTFEQKISEAEDGFRQQQSGDLAKLEAIERDAKYQTKELVKIEGAMRGEIEDLDHRLVSLADRILPVVRKTWLRVAELEKGPTGAGVDIEPRLAQMRREIRDELRHLDTDVTERLRDLRERMETTIAHQGKVWLTLIRQLSQLTEERRAGLEPPFAPLAAGPIVSPPEDRSSEADEESAARRRLRRAGRGPSPP